MRITKMRRTTKILTVSLGCIAIVAGILLANLYFFLIIIFVIILSIYQVRRNVKIFVGSIGCIAFVAGSLLAYMYITQPSRIYYQIDYSGTLSNMNSVIQRVEGLDYATYLQSTGEDFFSYMPVTFINRTVLDNLTAKIEADKYLHWPPSFSHNLNYFFSATIIDNLTVSYNNRTIANITHGEQMIVDAWDAAVWGKYVSEWYVNSSIVSEPGTLFAQAQLANATCISINFEYNKFLTNTRFIQTVVLTSELYVALILISNFQFSSG